jgi:hypothetical protein
VLLWSLPVLAQEPCVPRSTFLTTAKLTWTTVPLETIAGTATLTGFVVERQQNEQRQWTVLRDDLAPTTLEYLDPDLRPNREYRWQVRAKLTTTTGEALLSHPFAPGARPPCLRIVPLPAPGILQVDPVLP